MKHFIFSCIIAILLFLTPITTKAEEKGMCGHDISYTLSDDGTLTLNFL